MFCQSLAETLFAVITDRYHLYVAHACPFCCRALLAMNLKGSHLSLPKLIVYTGLNEVISVSFVAPVQEQLGGPNRRWVFSDAYPDLINNQKTLEDVYKLSHPEHSGRSTVPLLW